MEDIFQETNISHQKKENHLPECLGGRYVLVPRRVYKSGWQVNRFWCKRRKLTVCVSFVASKAVQ